MWKAGEWGGEDASPPVEGVKVLLIQAIQDSQKEWVAIGIIRCIRVLVRKKVLGRVEYRGVKGSDAGEFLLDGFQKELLVVICQAGRDPDGCIKDLLDSFDRIDECLW